MNDTIRKTFRFDPEIIQALEELGEEISGTPTWRSEVKLSHLIRRGAELVLIGCNKLPARYWRGRRIWSTDLDKKLPLIKNWIEKLKTLQEFYDELNAGSGDLSISEVEAVIEKCRSRLEGNDGS